MKLGNDMVGRAMKVMVSKDQGAPNAWRSRGLLAAFVWTAVLAVSVYWNWADLHALARPSASKPFITLAITHALLWLTGILLLAHAYYRLARNPTTFQDRENQPHANNRILETVFENIPAAVFWKDRDGVYQGCNQQFVQHVKRRMREHNRRQGRL